MGGSFDRRNWFIKLMVDKNDESVETEEVDIDKISKTHADIWQTKWNLSSPLGLDSTSKQHHSGLASLELVCSSVLSARTFREPCNTCMLSNLKVFSSC